MMTKSTSTRNERSVAVAVDKGDHATAISRAAHELAIGSRRRRFQRPEAGDDVRVDLLNLSVDHVSEHAGIRVELRLEGLLYDLVLNVERRMRLLVSARTGLAECLRVWHGWRTLWRNAGSIVDVPLGVRIAAAEIHVAMNSGIVI